jgi:hypothetical protein
MAGSLGDARHAPRRPASKVPIITSLRLTARGTQAALVNISTSGLLAECGEALRPGSQVTVFFEGGFSPPSVEGRVARCAVASMGPNGQLRFHVGIAFTTSIALPDDSAAPARDPTMTTPTEAPVATANQASLPSAAPVGTELPEVRNRW